VLNVSKSLDRVTVNDYRAITAAATAIRDEFPVLAPGLNLLLSRLWRLSLSANQAEVYARAQLTRVLLAILEDRSTGDAKQKGIAHVLSEDTLLQLFHLVDNRCQNNNPFLLVDRARGWLFGAKTVPIGSIHFQISRIQSRSLIAIEALPDKDLERMVLPVYRLSIEADARGNADLSSVDWMQPSCPFVADGMQANTLLYLMKRRGFKTARINCAKEECIMFDFNCGHNFSDIAVL
jgi:hypothetical protein